MICQKHFSVDGLFIYSEPKEKADAQRYMKSTGVNVTYVKADNLPLGAKLNAGLKPALKIKWNYLFGLGCDDIISDEYWPVLKEALDQEPDITGVTEVTIRDVATQEEFIFYCPIIIGAGRCLSRRVIERSMPLYQVRCLHSSTNGEHAGDLKYEVASKIKFGQHELVSDEKFYKLWDDGKMNALDTNSLMNITARTDFTDLAIKGNYITDLKTKHNINAFDKIPKIVLPR